MLLRLAFYSGRPTRFPTLSNGTREVGIPENCGNVPLNMALRMSLEKKKVALLTTCIIQEHKEIKYRFTKLVRVIEGTIDKHRSKLRLHQVTLEGWWTNLTLPESKIISLFKNHGLSEQFHSEFKTDLDLERLPSGKYTTNALVISQGVFADNILRYIGQLGLLGDKSPVRHPAKRRRLKTVIQELM